MLHKMFTVYDSKAGAFLAPFQEQTTGTAVRAFTNVVNQAGHIFNLHPGDYTLFEIAHYDDSTGQFENHSAPINLGVALNFITEVEAPLLDRMEDAQ